MTNTTVESFVFQTCLPLNPSLTVFLTEFLRDTLQSSRQMPG